MGKRKHKDKDSYYRRKYKRLRDRNRRESSSDEAERDGYRSVNSRSESPLSDGGRIYLSDSDDAPLDALRSIVVEVPPPPPTGTAAADHDPVAEESNIASTSSEPQPGPSGLSNSTSRPALSEDVLRAIGDPRPRGEVFGPKILDELSERWGRILVDGLTKDQKVEIQDNTLVPENFKFAKAPLLNPEITGILGEAVKNRDKLLEKAQNHLGLGVAALTSFASNIIQGDLEKIEIITKLSEICQIFMDLHNENTKTRRKLIMSSLDKNFNSSIADVKRDKYLFGENLKDRITDIRTAERSGNQIRRSDNTGHRRYPAQGNWRGPPRHSQRQPRPGGHRTTARFAPQPYHSYRRPPPSRALPPPPPPAERAPYPPPPPYPSARATPGRPRNHQ